MLKYANNTISFKLLKIVMCNHLPEVAKVKAKSKPIDIDTTLQKVADMQHEPDELIKRDMFIDFLGSAGLGLIDETKHQQPQKRYLP